MVRQQKILTAVGLPIITATELQHLLQVELRLITKIHGKIEENLQDMQGLRQKLPLLSRK